MTADPRNAEFTALAARQGAAAVSHHPRLSDAETARLTACEVVIGRGLRAFREVGEALNEIRGQRLYRDHYGTFENYAECRWGLGRSHAYRLIDAARVVGLLSPAGDIPAPVTERAARELVPLASDPAELRAVWREAADAAGGPPTADHVRAARTTRAGIPDHRAIRATAATPPGEPRASHVVTGYVDADLVDATRHLGAACDQAVKDVRNGTVIDAQDAGVLFRRLDKIRALCDQLAEAIARPPG